METLRLIIRILLALMLLSTAVGLYRPWMVLWWKDRQYRWLVIRSYGMLAAFLWFLEAILPDH